MMANEAYKARARRLAAHLKAKHNLSMSHSAALEAIAAEEGTRDWNTLAARSTEADSMRLAVEANVTHRVALGDPAVGTPARPAFSLAPAMRRLPAAGKSVFSLHAHWRRHGTQVVEVKQSLWDFVAGTSRPGHATERVAGEVAQCIQRRLGDCARGAATGRLSATLLQKEAMGLVRGAELVLEALDFPETRWRDACGQMGDAIAEAAAQLDDGWRDTARQRRAARPADLKL